MKDFYETSRLILRHFRMGDEQAIYELLSDPDVNLFLPMFPLQSVEEAKDYLQTHYLDKYKNQDGYYYAICLKENDRPIGYIQISGDESHDFGYALRKEFWHQEIVSEAALKMVEEFKTSDLPYITATHDVCNPHSGNVMKKIGMKYCYSYKEQWMPKNILVTFRMYQYHFKKDEDFIYLKYWNKYPHHIEKDI